jgi:Pvc16 N-terminal domain
VIDDLDRTLEALLRTELPEPIVSQVAITFTAPDDQFPPTSVTPPALDLFLFGVRENTELRSNEMIVERDGDGGTTRRRAPVRVACSYLVSAWASESSTTPALDEHRLLGETIAALARHRTIPAPLLQGRLAGQDPPLPATTLEPDRAQTQVDIWRAFGGKPRAAFIYTVTVGIDVLRPVEAGPPVVERRFHYRVDGEPAE